MTNTMRQPLRGFVAAAAILSGALLAGCTDDTGFSSSTKGPVPATEAEFVAWFGLAAEAALDCNQASDAVDALVDSHSETHGGADTNVEAALAAGHAYEVCSYALDGHDGHHSIPELEEIWGEGTTLLQAWLTSTAAANRSGALVFVGNGDSRVLVNELFDAQRNSDELADELDTAIDTLAGQLDVQVDDGLEKHRWEAPAH